MAILNVNHYQEQLRAIGTEELQKQSQSLALELQSQQLELQQTNQQLEGKAWLLLEQSAEVEHKNCDIDFAR